MRGYVKYGLFLLVIILSILWLGGFLSKKLSTQEVKKEVKVVQGLELGVVERLKQAESSYAGFVVADRRAEVSTRLMGKVVSVNVKEGECVSAGRMLVRVDATDVQAQVQAVEKQKEQAEQAYRSALAQYEAVKKTYDRYSKLLKDGAITQQEFDQVKAQFESAQAQLRQAKAGIESLEYQKSGVASQLSYANLTAPFSGCVVSKMVDVGDLAVPGQPLIVLESAPYKVEVHLPERLVERIKVSETLKVLVGNTTLEGRVEELSKAIDPATRTFKVKLSVPSNALRSGMLVNVLVPEDRNTLLVPKSSVVKRFDFAGVWVVKEDNTLELRFVRLGEEVGDKVEVLSGLKEGERIVIEGTEKACEGCKVGG
ncbi:efflux RND transporter periplasmic adaptor subunit [Thermocrinis sp.]